MAINLFNKEAMRSRREMQGSEKPAALLTPPLKATIGIGISVAAGATLWAFIAKIPINVNGIGVLLPVSTINERVSRNTGITIWMFDKPEQYWEKMALQFRRNPGLVDDNQLISLSNSILTSASTRSPNTQDNSDQPKTASKQSAEAIREQYKGLRLPKNKLLFWIYSQANQHQLADSLARLKTIKEISERQTKNLEKQEAILYKEQQIRNNLLTEMRALHIKRFITITQLLQEEQAINQIKNQVMNMNNERIQLDQQVEDARLSLREQLSRIVNTEMIFSSRGSYIVQIVPNEGQYISEGEKIIDLSKDSLLQPKLVPVFVGANDMATVTAGNSVIATPRGFQRSEVGGIKGTVVSVSRLPSNSEGVRARIGVSSIATEIVNAQGTPTLAVIALETTPDNHQVNSGGYRWTSEGNLPTPPRTGDQLNVEITTRRMRPIEFVIPAINQVLGITPPENQRQAANTDQATSSS